ncbi:ATP-grasp domain-containing protein [Methanoregula formicica]|uniref:Glutathione synthase/ribosomal protein S6 modification enzyme (Glutaminyl transferase) n=1 Tax=Methanoregula formicica (strain DSM 22288 / NBRC 105244 / SMSP) TaxID=593750 RepID=L0HF48_METFS|nr:ATP-grasp domain-containing protein [Methanoregula formicica]AGB02640.1 glutathione synthase/ribosomal protein S6 modification enzyme (glutaminyl transferase) [Methanoregula formicica SMSP]
MSRLGIFVDRKTLSNAEQLGALIRCRDVAEKMGHDVDFIFPVDIGKIPKEDALFIRARTDPMNVTFVAARMAAFHNIPVIDDPQSIRICSDKINMYSHLIRAGVSLPKTAFLAKQDLTVECVTHLFDEMGSPLILKEPSTSFSLRVEKVNDIAGFFRVARRFIRLSDWIVVQQYIESKYDWRVGVLDGKLLYACKYTIPSVTFKIQASVNGHIVYCGVESVPEKDVPPQVLRLGIEAANAIGHGLYGVDIKNTNGDAYVIEVNDNPSIESGEDDCYPRVFEQIVERLTA